MARRTTRVKLKFHAQAAMEDLNKTMSHFLQLAALADERSEYINDYMPAFVTTLQSLIVTFDKFREDI